MSHPPLPAMPPRVSVVVPAFNQARFLSEALRSALAQTVPAHEVIVVDDGSTDATAAVAAGFGEAVTLLRQPNRGLAAARNAAIRAATAESIAFLDSDDAWHPGHLAELGRLQSQWPRAAAWHTRARCVDASGRILPQCAGAPTGGRMESTFDQLVHANPILPSTAAVRRASLMEVGLFDEDPAIRGCEDRDLWLRLSRHRPIVGGPNATVDYRLHDQAMSAGVRRMQSSAIAVAQKHLGPEGDGSAAWAGVYGSCAMIALVRGGDWDGCADWLVRSLRIDPAMAADADLFYELALGRQPLGYRGSRERADLEGAAERMAALLARLDGEGLEPMALQAAARSAWLALARVAYNLGRPALARAALGRLLAAQPTAALSAGFWPLLARSSLPRSLRHLHSGRTRAGPP